MEPIIKRENVDESLAAGKFNFNSFEREAQRIIDGARQDAQAQMYKAQQEINKMRAEIRGEEFGTARKQGYNEGFEEGKKEGLEAGRKEAYDQHLKELKEATDGVSPMLTQLFDEVSQRREAMVEDAERDMLALSFTIAERLTRLRIETDSDVVRETLRNALDLVLNRSSLDIFANASDIEALEEHLPTLRRQIGDVGDVRLHADGDVPRGSVEVRTARGRVSINIDQQLNRIAFELLGISSEDAAKLVGASNLPSAGEASDADESDAASAGDEGTKIRSAESMRSPDLSNTNPVSIDDLSKDNSKQNTAEIVRSRLDAADPPAPPSVDDVVAAKSSNESLTRLIQHAETTSTDDLAKAALVSAERHSERMLGKSTPEILPDQAGEPGEAPASEQASEQNPSAETEASGDASAEASADAASSGDATDAPKDEAQPDASAQEAPRSFDVNEGTGSSSLDNLLADVDAAADEEEQGRE